MKLTKTSLVIKKFSGFAFLFICVYIAEIHIYYWSNIFVIILYCGFNGYCTLRFASILIQRYKIFIGKCILNKYTHNRVYNKHIYIYINIHSNGRENGNQWK